MSTLRRIACALLGHRAGSAYWDIRAQAGEAYCARCGHTGPANWWGQFL